MDKQVIDDLKSMSEKMSEINLKVLRLKLELDIITEERNRLLSNKDFLESENALLKAMLRDKMEPISEES